MKYKPNFHIQRLPNHVTNEEGAMVEPLSVALYSCRRAEVGTGSRVLILGAGPIGIISLLTAKAMGCHSVAITGINILFCFYRVRLYCDKNNLINQSS